MLLFYVYDEPGGASASSLTYCEVDTTTYNQLTASTLDYCEVDTSGYPRS
jgi:hypothetical protein